MFVLEQERYLFWKQKPNMDTVFQTKQVVTDNQGFRHNGRVKNAVLKVACMGASPTFGWGVENQFTYSSCLQVKLSEYLKDAKVKVFNAGQIGYSSFQGTKLFKKYIADEKPDIVTFSYVINDVDKFRFYRSGWVEDKNVKLSSSAGVFLGNLTGRSRLLKLLRLWSRDLLNKNKKLRALILAKQFNSNCTRVSEDNYRDNLNEIIDLTKKNGINLIFIKFPLNLSLPELTPEEKKLCNSKTDLSEYYFRKGQNLMAEKDHDKACFFLQKAIKYLVIRCQEDSVKYNKIMEEISSERNIALIDMVEKFGHNKGKFFNLPSDPIHPNALGHRVIAENLFLKIKEMGWI